MTLISPYQSFARLNQWAIHSVHLMIKPTGIAQVVPGAVASPQWSADCTTVHALSTFSELEVHCTFLRYERKTETVSDVRNKSSK